METKQLQESFLWSFPYLLYLESKHLFFLFLFSNISYCLDIYVQKGRGAFKADKHWLVSMELHNQTLFHKSFVLLASDVKSYDLDPEVVPNPAVMV